MKFLYKSWFVHNNIGHPLMWWVGLFNKDLAEKLHDLTLPSENEEVL